MNPKSLAVARGLFASIFQPPPRLTVSDWADECRRLPSTAAEPGRFRTSRVPYMRAIMDALGDETVRHVVFAKSAQVAGTTVGENLIGYLMHMAPTGILSVWPTVDKLRSWSTKNLEPLVQDTPALAAMFPASGRRSSKDTIAAKQFPGGFLQLLTAKSTAALRSTTARVIIAEEIDEWEGAIGDQGDPLEQLRARNRTFWNRKEYDVSTPTLWGFSRIWRELKRSTWDEYWVPCPHCREMQVLRWRDGEDDQDESGAYRLVFERDQYGEVVPGSTCYVCEYCGALIEERYKQGMLAAGEWRSRHPGRATRGFHIWTAYSPLCSWDDIAAAFLRAKDSPATLQGFVNLWLGLPFRGTGQRLESHALAGRAEPYAAPVPHGVGGLTAFVDVQGDRLELFVWGWGAGDRSWVIAWEQLEGDPGRDGVWARLAERLRATWQHESGAPVTIAACAIDAGYQTDRVHRFCDNFGRFVFATVGRSGRGRQLLTAPGPQKRKRTGKRNRPVHVIGVDSGKDLIASRLRIGIADDGSKPPGYVTFPDTLDPVFYEQLTAEQLVTVYSAGRPSREWKLIEGRRNEALDGAVGALAALEKLGPGVRRKLGEMAEKLSAWSGSAAAPVVRARRRVRSRGVV